MPEEALKYIEKKGVYHIQLSRTQVEEFIQYARSFENIKPSLENFARRKALQANILDEDAKVIVDFSQDLEPGQKVDLSNLDFSNLDISKVKFSGANMQGCKFKNAILDSADFSGAILDSAVFKNCRAKGAHFVRTKLNNVTIDNSVFRETFLTDSQGDSIKIINSDLNEAVIRNADWNRAMITDSNLSNCLIDNAHMLNATFDKVKLQNVSASQINLHQATIKPNCSIKNIDLNNATLTYAQLQNCTINADLTSANLLKANLEGASISRARTNKPWYQPSSETIIKNTARASKVVVGTSKVVTSTTTRAKNMFSKLWGSNTPAAQEAVEAPGVKDQVNIQSHSQHYHNIVNTLTTTRLVAEDFVHAKNVVDNLTKIVAGLFDQDYFFPRANNYQLLVEQIEKAHDKGYIDEKYKEEFIKELRKIEIDTTLSSEVLSGLSDEIKEMRDGNKISEELLESDNKPEVIDGWQEIMPIPLEQEIEKQNQLNAPKIAEMQKYYADRHAEFTHYMLKARIENLVNEGILNPQEQKELNEQLRDKNGKFEERVNQTLEKKILINAAEKLKPFLHVLSDPQLANVTKLLGEGQNREQTLAILDSLKDNTFLQKLEIDQLIDRVNINDTLLKYIGIAPSIIALIIPMMKYEQEFAVILSGLQDMFRAPGDIDPSQGPKNPDQAMNAISAICSLLQRDPALRRLFTEEIEKMTQVLLGIFEGQIQASGLEVDFLNQVITFSKKLAQAENSEMFGLFAAVINMIQDPKSALESLQKAENYIQLKDIVQKVLPNFINNQNPDIKSLIEQFLMKTINGSLINNQIAAVLGVDTTKSLELKDAYIQAISSVVNIAAVMMNHKTDCMLLIQAGQSLIAGSEGNISDYLKAVTSGVKLLKQQDVRTVINQELPKIFVATNGVLENKLKSFGLSQEFAMQAVDLVSKIVVSDEMGKILEFTNDLLMLGITLDKKGQMSPSEVMNQLIVGIKEGDYKVGFQGFVALVGNVGKYKELRALVQGTLPALIQNNKEQIVPLMEEFIKNTDLGKKINIDVNDILNIASQKNKNFLDLANYWGKGSYGGVLKETVKLLTSPMVAGFLLEIAGKVAWSYLFKSKKDVETPVQGPDGLDNRNRITQLSESNTGNKTWQTVVPSNLTKKNSNFISSHRVTESMPETEKSNQKSNLNVNKSAINPQNDEQLQSIADGFNPRNKPQKRSKKKMQDQFEFDVPEENKKTIDGGGLHPSNDSYVKKFAPKQNGSPSQYKTKEIKSRHESYVNNVESEAANPLSKGKS